MAPPNDTAEKILDAAATLIAERGYAATTTRAIAERAGVNEVTLFRRFESKAGILAALGERLREASAAGQAAAASQHPDARAALLALARAEVTAAEAHGGLALRLAFDARSVPEVDALLGDGPRENLDRLAGRVAGWQAAGEVRPDLDPRVVAEAFFSLTSSYVMYRTMIGAVEMPADAASDPAVEQLFEVFWSGVRAERDETRSTP